MTIQMWMKIAGALMVIAGASGFGFWLAGQYGQRLRELEQLRQMIFLLKGQILYANAPLSEAFETVVSRTEGALSDLFIRVAERIDGQQGESFSQIWQEEVSQPGKPGGGLAMSKADRQTLKSLGEHLGFLDRDMQESAPLSGTAGHAHPADAGTQTGTVQTVHQSGHYGRAVFDNPAGIGADEEENEMGVNLIFKIAAVGILVSVICQVLKHSGREEQAFLTSLAGLILVLFWMVPYIYELFETIKNLFAL